MESLGHSVFSLYIRKNLLTEDFTGNLTDIEQDVFISKQRHPQSKHRHPQKQLSCSALLAALDCDCVYAII